MSNTKRVVLVGIAGVGKSTVVNEVLSILETKDVKVDNLTFGTIMFEEAQKLGISDRDEMRTLSTDKQQELQINAAKSIANIESDIVIIDTHLFIKTTSGYMPGLPISILKSLLQLILSWWRPYRKMFLIVVLMTLLEIEMLLL